MQQQLQQATILVACSTEANVTAWDLCTAAQLTQYKANACGRNRFCRLGPDYFVAAQHGKDAVHFWTWHKDQVLQRCFVQEALAALAASPNGSYLVGGGVSGALYIWDTSTGALLRTWPAHYKAVTCLVFSDSGGVLVSASEDTLVSAWLLAEVLDPQLDHPSAAAISAMTSSRVQPLHTWSQHTLPVTSLYLGMGEGGAVLVTASLDRSIKLWNLGTGQLLRGVTLPAGVTSVTMDAGEHVVLAGCADGSIYEVSLVGPVERLQAVSGSSGSSDVIGGPGSTCYEGHVKAISSLVITPDGDQLVSGSEDGTVRVWDLRSRQTLRVISAPSKAPVSGVLLVPGPLGQGGVTPATSSSSMKESSKTLRLQPLAALAKYTGATSGKKAWEGSLVVLDAARCSSSSRVTSTPAPAVGVPEGLFIQPSSDPLQLLRLCPLQDAAAQQVADVVPDAEAAGAAGGAAVAGVDSQRDVQQLQQQVAQLQQQLLDAQQVAGKWQELHGQLHKFCTEQVLAGCDP